MITSDQSYQNFPAKSFDFCILFSNHTIVMANFSTKLASTVSAAAIVASAMGASLVSAASEFLPYAEALAAKKVINSQNAESGYRLNDQITRAELAKVAANLGGYTAVKCTGNVYTDVTASLGDLCDAIETLAAAKVISTASNTFRPTANVTRAEMTKMILGALAVAPSSTSAGYSDVNSSLGDLEGFINAAAEKNIVNKATYFRPNATGSRGEVFKIAARAAGLDVNNNNNPTDPAKPGATTGNISVTSVGSATAQYVPRNASSVKVGTIKVTATGGDVALQSLVITRSGLGASTDVESSNGIRAAIDGKIVSSNGYYNSSSQQGNIYFTPSITIKNGESKNIDILVSLNNDAEVNSQHQFSITSVNTQTITPVTLGLINTTAYKTGVVRASLSNKASEVKPGSKDQRLISVRIQPSDRDITLDGFAVTRDNTAQGGVTRPTNDLTKSFNNVTVLQNGKAVGKATVTADKIFVSGLNTPVKVGSTATFDLRADVLLDGVNNGVSLKIEDSSDVSAKETSTNQITRVEPTTTVQTIKFANVTNSFVSNNTAKLTVAPGTDDVKFFDAKLTSSVPVIVKKIKVSADLLNPANGVTRAQFANNFAGANALRVRVNGLEVGQIDNTKLTAGDDYEFTTSFVVDENSPANITVEGNVITDAKLGTLRFKTTLVQVEDMSRNNAILQTTSRTGNDISISNGSVNTYSTSVSNPINTIAANTVVDMGSVGIQSRDQDIKVKKLAFKAVNTTLTGLNNIVDTTNEDNVSVYMDGSEISGTAVVNGNDITFTPDNEIYISKSTRKDFTLKLRTKNFDAAAYGKTLQYELDKDNTDVFAQNVDSGVRSNRVSTLSNVKLSSKAHTVGILSPRITAVKRIEGTNIAEVTVENADADKNIKTKELKLSITARGKDANFNGAIVALKDGINSDEVPAAAGGKVNGADFVFDTSRIGNELTEGAEQKFFVTLTGVTPDDTVVVTVKEITYEYNKTDRKEISGNAADNVSHTETRSVIAK